MVLFLVYDPLSGRLDTILDGDPGRAGRDILPPPGNIRLGIENVAACCGQPGADRNVEEISEGDFLASHVLLLAQDLVVYLELLSKFPMSSSKVSWLVVSPCIGLTTFS